MNIVLIGASGYVGSALLTEALARGHEVTAIVQHPEKLRPQPRLQALAVNVLDAAALAPALRGHEAVISAFSGHAEGDVRGYYLRGFASIVAAVKTAAVPRLLVVGGAGSLEVAPGVALLDTPDFPAAYRASAEGARDALIMLRAEPTLDWTLLSPSALLVPGERSGKFRLGGDQLLVGSDGQSRITVPDYAVALIDELEHPRHHRQRFTVGY